MEDVTNKKVFHIDGDEIRLLFKNINYGREGREENIKRAQDISKFSHSQGCDVIVSLVTPYKEIRENFKTDIGDEIVEIYVHTTDIRGREHFHSEEYERPTENYIDVDTTNIEPNSSLKQIVKNI